MTVGLTGLREVTHALFLFSSLFAFSHATFFNGCDSVMNKFIDISAISYFFCVGVSSKYHVSNVNSPVDSVDVSSHSFCK